MTRGETKQNKVHFKSADDDWIVFVDDLETYKKWQTDKSVSLIHFVSSFKVFVTHSQGVSGTLDSASNSAMDNEFKTHVLEDVIKRILEKGQLQEVEFPERQVSMNDSRGPRVAH